PGPGRWPGRDRGCGDRRLLAPAVALVAAPAVDPGHARPGVRADGPAHGPRHRLRPAGGDAGDQAGRVARAARCAQPARLLPVRPVRRVPARPGPADDAAGPGRGARRFADPAAPGRCRGPCTAATARPAPARDGPAGGDRTATGAGRVLVVPAAAFAVVGRAGTGDGPPGHFRAHGTRRLAGLHG